MMFAAEIEADPEQRRLNPEPDDDLELGDRVGLWMFAPAPWGNVAPTVNEDLPEDLPDE